MDNTQYYISRNNGPQEGPFALNQISLFVTTGRLARTDLIWREGLTNWESCANVPEIGGLFVQSPPPIPGVSPVRVALTDNQNVRYAGFWIRFVAAFLDGLIVGIALLPVSCVSNVLMMAANPGGWPSSSRTFDPADPFGFGRLNGQQWLIMIVSWLIQMIAQGLYSALMESSSRQATLGKMALGLRVTTMDGNRISFARATGRYFAKMLSGILLIGYIIAAFTPMKQALHDLLAKTLVMQVRQ